MEGFDYHGGKKGTGKRVRNLRQKILVGISLRGVKEQHRKWNMLEGGVEVVVENEN